MGLNGARFLDVYIPDIGMELRIQVEDIEPAPVYGDWDAKAKCVLCCCFVAEHLSFPCPLQGKEFWSWCSSLYPFLSWSVCRCAAR